MVGCTTGSRGEVPEEIKLVIRHDYDNNDIKLPHFITQQRPVLIA
jgi:hypothetical protein